jgi:hypothetical protein
MRSELELLHHVLALRLWKFMPNAPKRGQSIGLTRLFFPFGPDYGIFELTVDGQDIKKGLQVDLEIYDYVRAHGSSNRITSRLVAEVFPRNTGK